MTSPRRAPSETHWYRALQARLHNPTVLTIIAVAFFISAVGQAAVEAYIHDDFVVTTAVLSILGSVFLAAAIIIAARRHDQATRNQPSPGRHTN